MVEKRCGGKMGDLGKMLNPKTVAFIGADDRAGSRERSILDNLLSSEGRRIWAVNPDKRKVLDLDCLSSVSDIDEHIDLAVIVAPDDLVLSATEECGNKGVEGAIIISPGPEGSIEERKGFEERIWEIRKRCGMRVIGPNSGGVILPRIGLNATFLEADLLPGSTAFVSQSGTIAAAMLYWGIYNRIGFSMFASLGSMADVDLSDLIDLLQEDYFTKSIMLYVERIKDAKKFISASRCFARDKPIVILKPGRYPESTEALIAHTGIKVGNDAVYDAAFKRAGIVRVKETDDFFDTAKVLISRSLPRGPRLAVITNSGGIGIIAFDALVEQKGRLAVLSKAGMEKLDRIMPCSWSRSNPLDLSRDADVERYAQVTDVCLKDDGVDGALIIYAPASHADPGELARRLVGCLSKAAKPVVAVWMGDQYSREGIEVFREANVPVYGTPEEAVRAYIYMLKYHRGIELLYETPEEAPENEMRLTTHLRGVLRDAVMDQRDILTPDESAGFLKNYGIPILEDLGQGGDAAAQERVVDEWALRSLRDLDFGVAILLICMTGGIKGRSGFAVGLPPLNRVLARRLIEEAEFSAAGGPAAKRMEEVLINFAKLIVDFPEIAEIEIECAVTAGGEVYARHTAIQVDKDYQKGIVQYPHLIIMPYPSRYTIPWKIRDGRDVLLRPLRAEDEPLVREMLSSLSEETLRVRFFVVMEITHRMLMHFCNIDYDREIAIAAELKEEGGRRIIGGCRLIVEPDSGKGQFAILIHDEFQKQGLGEKLLDAVIGIARDKGLQEIYGIVLTENDKMLRLSKRMGFKSTVLPDGISKTSLQLD
ncbi:MAG TPA: GNAT family N-acetyltransferase [Syntrophorhabdaceae bacterium]|nr:GNAT family N-acetyltransferase [Syntrophorhabdaceae bacterium]